MNIKTGKAPAQTNRAYNTPEQATAPCRSLVDSRTWLGLLDSVENIKYSTQIIFKLSRKYLIEAAHGLEPILLYDNIILGMSGNKLAILFDGKFEYVRNQLLPEAINQEIYSLAISVFGTCIAGYIFDELTKKYEKVFDVDEYCDLVRYTFDFKLCQLNDVVSQWVCRFINGQAGLEDAPEELRTTNFHFWESNHFSKDTLYYQSENDCLYSVGCFLENVLSD